MNARVNEYTFVRMRRRLEMFYFRLPPPLVYLHARDPPVLIGFMLRLYLSPALRLGRLRPEVEFVLSLYFI